MIENWWASSKNPPFLTRFVRFVLPQVLCRVSKSHWSSACSNAAMYNSSTTVANSWCWRGTETPPRFDLGKLMFSKNTIHLQFWDSSWEIPLLLRIINHYAMTLLLLGPVEGNRFSISDNSQNVFGSEISSYGKSNIDTKHRYQELPCLKGVTFSQPSTHDHGSFPHSILGARTPKWNTHHHFGDPC